MIFGTHQQYDHSSSHCGCMVPSDIQDLEVLPFATPTTVHSRTVQWHRAAEFQLKKSLRVIYRCFRHRPCGFMLRLGCDGPRLVCASDAGSIPDSKRRKQNLGRLRLVRIVVRLRSYAANASVAFRNGRAVDRLVYAHLFSIWFDGADIYPADCIIAFDRDQASGQPKQAPVVRFSVKVGGDGLPKSCEITSSSDVDLLDNFVCSRVMQRARFKPKLDAAGVPVAFTFNNAVRFEIPLEPPKALPKI